MAAKRGQLFRIHIPTPKKFNYSESDLINRTIDRAFLKNICFMQKGRLLLQQGPFIEIKFEKLQVNSSMGDRYFHVINMIPITTEATSLAQK